MELPVWVEGSLRVVCGVSQSTRCQEVVIALAQDIGQTGRFVLTLKLRDSEKQLLKDQCPLRELSDLGPDSAHARFILRRTGPSASSLHAQKPSPRDRPRPRTSTPDPLPPRRSTDAEPGSLYGTYPRRGKPKTLPAPSAQKEQVYLQLLQQARTIQELEESIEEQERQAQDSELNQDHGPVLELALKEQLEALEERQRQNEEELQQEQYWRQQLEEENHRAKDLSVRLDQLQWSVHHQTQRLSSIQSRSQNLQTDTQRQSEQALRPLEQELNQRHLQGERITAALEETRRGMHNSDRRMRMQVQLLEELNKDLRQCNLQQFILQASGSAPSELSVQSETVSGLYDVTKLRPGEEIYLSSADILE
ncbi:ras association domain-containing protein 7-like [Eucyclogobius newberryi]|uniref:ras association domain-containing protein 7-like n=1 Tax=Eucyclogobius newberryi TaxID=166745 RepID=UPI003B58CF59